MSMKPWLAIAFVAFSLSYLHAQEPSNDLRLLEMSEKNISAVSKELGASIQALGKNLALVPKSHLKKISSLLHHVNGNCGGFIDVTDEPLHHFKKIHSGKPLSEIEQEPLPEITAVDEAIVAAVNSVEPKNIQDFANLYSGSFETRVADSDSGRLAAEWLRAAWTGMAAKAGRDDVIVELIRPHTGYEQSSVRITIPGTDPNRGIVAIGAHLDSINASWLPWEDEAPGVDDDASGIATMTEAFRVMLQNNFRPTATVQLFGYAAEEVGLIGSRAIAQSYRDHGAKVAGVMQLDMTGAPGKTGRMTFIRDHTSNELTDWTQKLYTLYVGLAYVDDKCGYACSDHASWHRYQYRAVFPFESPFNESNSRIHTSEDLWDDHMSAEYAALFARLAIAFTAELAR